MHIVLPPLLSECLNWKKKTRRKIAEFLTFSVFFSSAFAYAVECFSFCQCLKFKADQAQDAKKMEKLNSNFFTLMSRGPHGMVNFEMGCICIYSHPNSVKGNLKKLLDLDA